MKKLYFWMLLFVAGLGVSCSKNIEGGDSPAGERDIVLRASLPAGMTTYGSADGGLTNVTGKQLRFICEVFSESGVSQGQTYQIIDPAAGAQVSFSYRLPAKKYKFAFWADFTDAAVAAQTAGTSADADLHYATGDLRAVMDIRLSGGNDESRDAYAGTLDVDLTEAGQSLSLTLERPFGKVRIQTGDLTDGGLIPVPVTAGIQVKGVGTEYDVYEGKVVEAAGDIAFAETPAQPLEKEDGYSTLAFDYFFSDRALSMNFVAVMPDGSTITRDLGNVPMAANKLTTVRGNLLSGGSKLSISVDDEFKDELPVTVWDGVSRTEPAVVDGAYQITTAAELAWLQASEIVTNANTFNLDGQKIELQADIDLNGQPWMPIRMRGGEFDGNGHTIRNLNVDQYGYIENASTKQYGDVGFFGFVQRGTDGVVPTIKNVTIEGGEVIAEAKWVGALAGRAYANFENCHVKDVVVNAVGPMLTYRIGGMVGFWPADLNATIKDCSVTNADITGSYSMGGMVGSAQSGNKTFENCSVSGITINQPHLSVLERYYDPETGQGVYFGYVGNIVGDPDPGKDKTYTFINCSAPTPPAEWYSCDWYTHDPADYSNLHGVFNTEKFSTAGGSIVVK